MLELTRKYIIVGTHAERLAFNITFLEDGRRWIESDLGYEYVKYDGVWHTPPTGGGGPHTHPESDVTNLVTDLAGKEPANANIQAHVTSAHAPANAQKNSDILKAEIEAKLTGEISPHTHAGGGAPIGYAINVQALTSSPADNVTVYFGMLPKAPITTANVSKCYVRAAGTIKRAEIYCYSGTAGTNQAWSLYIRKNNTTDYLIATLSVATNERVFSNAALSIPMAASDYFEIKGVQPTWTTNPLTTIYGGYVYIE